MNDPGVGAGMGRRFTILFTEDDRLVRDAVAELLRQHGFEVLVAEDGYDAIRQLMAQPVDLLFTDIVMPGISGFELARQAKLIRPNLNVLYLTGHFGHAAGRDGVRYGKLLEKPLRADEILTEVVQALAG
jgi:CheY-like chemotaxis protein